MEMNPTNQSEKRNMSAIETWDKAWSKETHTTEYAKKRIKSAKSAKLTPVKIDTEDLYGYFQGSYGRYETFLDYCPCGDFFRSKLPCKHIYRLAIELGILDEKAETNINSIPLPRDEKASLDDEIDVVEGLSEAAQKLLNKITSNLKASNPVYTIQNDHTVEELLNSGIIVDTMKEHVIIFGRKKEIIELLEAENVPYSKSDTVNDLKQICMNNIPEKTKERFKEIITVMIPPIYSPHRIHNYLHRKYDYDVYYDYPDIGCVYRERILETELPKDHITEQLIKRGYYNDN